MTSARGSGDGLGVPPPSTAPGKIGLSRVYVTLVELNNLLLIPVFSIVLIDILALAFDLPHADIDGLEEVHEVICALFFMEWLIGLFLADAKAAYLKSPHRLLDLVSSIPLGYFFQSVRLVRALRVLRLLRIVWRMRRIKGQLKEILRVTGLVTATAISGAVALRMLEPQTVSSFDEALWWSIVTMSTVGYGDISPVTPTGRLVAMSMIVLGIAIFGYGISVLTSIVVDPEEGAEEESTRALILRLEARILSLEDKLERSLPEEPS